MRPTPWLTETVHVTRGAVLGAALVVGLLCATAIIVGKSALDRVRQEREDRLAETQRSIERDQLTSADVAAIVERLINIEQPSSAEFFQRGLVVCRRTRGCARVLQRPVTAPPPPSGGQQDAPGPSKRPGRPSPQRPATPSPSAPAQPTVDAPIMPTVPPEIPPEVPPSPFPVPPVPLPARPPVQVQVAPVGPVGAPPVCTPIVVINCRK